MTPLSFKMYSSMKGVFGLSGFLYFLEILHKLTSGLRAEVPPKPTAEGDFQSRVLSLEHGQTLSPKQLNPSIP